jgi:HEAT repeat protein
MENRSDFSVERLWHDYENSKGDKHRVLLGFVRDFAERHFKEDSEYVSKSDIELPGLVLPKSDLALASAACALRELGHSVVPALIEGLKDTNFFVRCACATTIQKFGPSAKEAIPALVDALNDSSFMVRDLSLSALKSMDSADRRTVPELMEFLSVDEPHLQMYAAWKLGNLGRSANQSVELLFGPLLGMNFDASDHAAVALSKIAPEGTHAVPQFIEGLKHPDSMVRIQALRQILAFGRESPHTIPALISAMKDDEGVVRMLAAHALGSFGEAAKSAVPALIDALKRRESDPTGVVSFAALTLGGIGPAAKAAVPALIKSLDDEYARGPSIVALGLIGPPATEAVPSLMKYLLEKNLDEDSFAAQKSRQIKIAAANALAMIRPTTRDVIPALMFASFGDDRLEEAEDMLRSLLLEAVTAMANHGSQRHQVSPKPLGVIDKLLRLARFLVPKV